MTPEEALPPVCTVIVPAYNEEDGLAVVLAKLVALRDERFEILVVDDGSSDRTAAVARTFPCRMVRHETNRGKGEALKTGIREAWGEIVIWLDADDTYPPEVIPQMIDALTGQIDLVYASRLGGRDRIPAFNRIGNALFSWSAQHLFGFVPKDPCTGLCGVRKIYLERMNLTAGHFAIEVEIAAKAGRMKLRMLDMPIHYGDRIGTAKLSGPKAGLEITLHIIRYLFWRPAPERT